MDPFKPQIMSKTDFHPPIIVDMNSPDREEITLDLNIGNRKLHIHKSVSIQQAREWIEMPTHDANDNYGHPGEDENGKFGFTFAFSYPEDNTDIFMFPDEMEVEHELRIDGVETWYYEDYMVVDHERHGTKPATA